MNAPKRERRHGKTVAGIQIRTNRARELEPEQAQMGRLWEKFDDENLQQTVPDKAAGSSVYGVYTEFDNGEDGDFSVLAGVEITDEEKVPEGYVTVTLESGEYLLFEGHGRKPEVMVELWSRIWDYFQQPDAPQRAFATDYEIYESTDKVTVCVGIK